ncbi:MAG: ferredoxin family protein [Bacillota bacterium]
MSDEAKKDPTPRSPSQVAATGPDGGRIVPDVPGNPQPGTPATQKSLDEKLYLIRYRLDDRPHLAIKDQSICADYHEETGRPCAFFCPAHVYEWDEAQKKTIVEYERCVECGACRLGCPYGNIDWKYPRGGFGVTWKYG